MPGTTLAFTTGALGMIGIPPVAGFISKWYLGLGAMEAREEGRAARALLLSLKRRDQTVVALHYLEGLSVDEIAALLRVRPGTVKSRLSRARDRLRERMKDWR